MAPIWLSMGVAMFGAWLLTAAAQGTDRVQPGPEQVQEVLPRDAIPSIDAPEFDPADRARRYMSDNELVIGLAGEREQRAYSTWQLDRHEIVNDVFEGRPVAVTWCPLCGTGIVYSRDVGGRVLTFGVSGLLYKDALVMYDRETESLWTHVDGRGVSGAMAGRELSIIPALHATWKEWRALHPNTRVLRKQGEFRSAYEDYNRNPVRLGIHGRRNTDTRLPGKERILGLRVGGAAMAFPLKAVKEVRLVEAVVGGLPVVLVAPGPDLPVLMYERRARSTDLTFRLEGNGTLSTLRDHQSGSTWDLSTGKAVAGPMTGEYLPRATAYPAFWFGWRGYFPHTDVWAPSVRR